MFTTEDIYHAMRLLGCDYHAVLRWLRDEERKREEEG